METVVEIASEQIAKGCATCADYDDECPDVRDKVACYLYDPGRGMCPYLRSED